MMLSIETSIPDREIQEILQRLLTECPAYIKKVGDKYVTLNNQLKLNPVIQKIALIASISSAGFEDFVHTLQNNSHHYRVYIDNCFTAVQGQAVAKFPIPVITGIGHQRNETIVDILAHSPTNAPTKAAEFIIAHNRVFEEALLNAQKTILIKSQQLCSARFQELATLNSVIVNKTRNIIADHKDAINQANQVAINTTKSILFKRKSALAEITNQILLKPRSIVYNKQNDFKNLVSNIRIYSRNYFQNQIAYVAHFVTIFKMMSPESILKKGFAIVYHKGKIVSNPENISIGNDITILLSQTEINASVKSKNKSDGTEFKL